MATSGKKSSGARANLPGLDYMRRMGEAWQTAMMDQLSATQQAWEEAMAGNYDHKTAARLWAGAAASYYDFFLELSRGPNYSFHPAWIRLPHKLGETLPLKAAVAIDRAESQNTELEATDFTPLRGGAALKNLYDMLAPTPSGRELVVELDVDALNKQLSDLTGQQEIAGQYLSFVTGKGRGAEPPLAIVVLSVTA